MNDLTLSEERGFISFLIAFGGIVCGRICVTFSSSPELVAILMGSSSDWAVLSHTANMLDTFSVSYSSRVISAHRTPERLISFGKQARENGFKVIIAGAGGAAHLPGMIAALTTLPVLGVPIPSTILSGQDSLLSIVQMPGGVPVGTLAIGQPGAINAALLAVSILALQDASLAQRWQEWRAAQTAAVPEKPQ